MNTIFLVCMSGILVDLPPPFRTLLARLPIDRPDNSLLVFLVLCWVPAEILFY
ncbi:MAG: hypothetical protein GF344_04540 [Chitinivibrionales bacterium]|nr:hypothetical protein [Chitinivibrionales bacterium]